VETAPIAQALCSGGVACQPSGSTGDASSTTSREISWRPSTPLLECAGLSESESGLVAEQRPYRTRSHDLASVGSSSGDPGRALPSKALRFMASIQREATATSFG
jgi:hypothetical protein